MEKQNDANHDPLNACRLCPHECGVNRRAGLTGRCRAGDTPIIFRHGLHDGEEPPISGTQGSGAIFFSHCTLHCLYCQNYPWSQQDAGDPTDRATLEKIMTDLADRGAHNWNLVSPTPWLPAILPAIENVKQTGIKRPLVYNTSGFEKPETLQTFSELLDVALIDLRYAKTGTALEASGTKKYVEASRATLQHCWKALGPLKVDSDGIAQRGVICRLLVLPGHADEACDNLKWLKQTLGNEVAISLMAQYTPVYHAAGHPVWGRRINRTDYEQVCDQVEALGFENGWIQELQETPPDGLLGCTMEQNDAPAR